MMLRSVKDLMQYVVCVDEAEAGIADDFLFDEMNWMIRYMVVEIVAFPSSQRVLIAPRAILEVEWTTRRFELAVTKAQLANRPDVAAQNSVSPHPHEVLHQHLGSPSYWHGAGTHPTLVSTNPSFEVGRTNVSRLRSANDVFGYDIQANDGSIGQVDDFIVADDNWQLRYLVIDTSNWWSGKRILIAPQWATQIGWEQGKIRVEMSRQAVKACPLWDPTVTVHRDYESRLYEHYSRPAYWETVEPYHPEVA